MKSKYLCLLIGMVLGMIFIFLFPMFPVSIPNMAGTSTSLWWNSGLMQVGISNLNLCLLETFGGICGLLVTLIFLEVKD